MNKIYKMINKENGISVKCSDKNLIQWVIRGFSVENFILIEPLKEGNPEFQEKISVNNKLKSVN